MTYKPTIIRAAQKKQIAKDKLQTQYNLLEQNYNALQSKLEARGTLNVILFVVAFIAVTFLMISKN